MHVSLCAPQRFPGIEAWGGGGGGGGGVCVCVEGGGEGGEWVHVNEHECIVSEICICQQASEVCFSLLSRPLIVRLVFSG